MERRLLSEFSEDTTLSAKSATAALSLITNPLTSDSTVSTIIDTLTLHLQNPNPNLDYHRLLSLLSAVSFHHPRFDHLVAASARSFVGLPSFPIQSIPYALSLLDEVDSVVPGSLLDESLFLSLCFWQCVKTRRWALRNLSKFGVRPSVLLTVLLGFTKDPYPYIRESALRGLVLLSSGHVVEDLSMAECIYFRAVELLFDKENSVRHAAVRAVSEWGHLLLLLNPDESKRVWSDALFLQLCVMTRDMDVETRSDAFTELSKIRTVSVDILLQTLSKKAFPAIKEKNYPGQYTANQHNIPASASAFTFAHGLEDEFSEVRRSACRALQILTVVSAEFAGEAVHRVMDLLNDDSVVVRLQALETLHYMNTHDHLKVEESHLYMFFGTLIDSNDLIRSASRMALQSTKLQQLAMFRSCIDVFIKSLELYPQDENEIFFVLFKIGRAHGNFVDRFIREVSKELEPSFDGKLDFDNVRTVALLVLAISAPVSLERRTCCIPPQLYSYAVTLLGRISCGLIDIMDKKILLAYLSHCSRFTIVSASECLGAESLGLHSEDHNVHLSKRSSDISGVLDPKLMELKKVSNSLHQLEPDVKASFFTDIIFQKVVHLWPLIQLGCQNEVIQTLRNWKEEVRRVVCHSNQPADLLAFALNYLHVVKLLGKAWACYMSMKKIQLNGIGVLEALLGKTERVLREMLYRFIGLSRDDELHILELILVTYAMRLSYRVTCLQRNVRKMHSMLSCVNNIHKEGSVELSQFVLELQSISSENSNFEEMFVHKLDILEKSLNLFSLRHILPGELNYMKAEMDIGDNDFQNPLPFVSGLPIGIPIEITLFNISSENRLWLAMTLAESTQFVFLDLDEHGGCNEIRKFMFIAPFRGTPKVKNFCLKVSIAMECLSEVQHFKHFAGPKHELVHLCKGKEVYLSIVS